MCSALPPGKMKQESKKWEQGWSGACWAMRTAASIREKLAKMHCEPDNQRLPSEFHTFVTYIESEKDVSSSKDALQYCPFCAFLFRRGSLRWCQCIPYAGCGDKDASCYYQSQHCKGLSFRVEMNEGNSVTTSHIPLTTCFSHPKLAFFTSCLSHPKLVASAALGISCSVTVSPSWFEIVTLISGSSFSCSQCDVHIIVRLQVDATWLRPLGMKKAFIPSALWDQSLCETRYLINGALVMKTRQWYPGSWYW